LNKTIEEIVKYTEGLDKESKALIKDTLRLAWYMRGGLTTTEAYMLTFEEREAINDIVKENMEWSKELGHPVL
jgi:hypothetical protein